MTREEIQQQITKILVETFEIDLVSASGPVRLIIPSDLQPPAIGANAAVEALPGAVTFI